MEQIVSVYSDGGMVDDGVNYGSRSTVGGTWAWCHVDAAGQRIAVASGVLRPSDIGLESVTNNIMELWALVECLEALPPLWSGQVVIDSQVTLWRMTKPTKWAGCPVFLRQRAMDALARVGKLEWKLVSGHTTAEDWARGVGAEHNVWCDEACGRQKAILRPEEEKRRDVRREKPVAVVVKKGPMVMKEIHWRPCTEARREHQLTMPW